MKAALMYGSNDVRVEEIPSPEYDSEGLLLKVEVVGLCGSDIRNLTTDSRKGDYPHIYGHEVVGTVAEIGDKETRFNVGDRLYVYPAVPCLKCEYCRAGNSHSCENLRLYDQTQGGFAQYMAVPSWGLMDQIFIGFLMKFLSKLLFCQNRFRQCMRAKTMSMSGWGKLSLLSEQDQLEHYMQPWPRF